MIRPMRSHPQYLEFFQTRRAELQVKVPHNATELWCKFRHTDLSAVYALCAPLYDAQYGRPAFRPDDMLRSWLLMLECHVTSVEVWVHRLHEQPVYALLSGFDPEAIPGVGTFYAFQDRLLQLHRSPVNQACRPHRRDAQRQGDPALRDKHDTAPHSGILNRLAERLTARFSTPAPYGQWSINLAALPVEQRILKAVFYLVFVSTSVAHGLLDLHDLHVAGDGTHLPTWANPRGHKLCSCDNRHKPRAQHCDCLRRYHDPLASWGWDSYRECYVYGHGLYELTAYSLKHDCQLPLVITLLDNHRHDSVAYLAAMHEAVDLLGLPIATASLDKAHDNLALYRLGAEHWHLHSVIPLNQRHAGHFTYEPPCALSPDGTPLCAAGQPMVYWGYCPDRQRLKWRCPLKTQRTPEPEPACACSPSRYGRVVYTYPAENYRLFSPLRRGSPLWALHADRRSCAERSIKRKKLDFGLEQTRLAGRVRWFFRVMLAAMCQHLDAWQHHARLVG